MSGSWAAFALNGKPDSKGLPHGPPYAPDERATMIFDNECRVVNDPDREEHRAIQNLASAAG